MSRKTRKHAARRTQGTASHAPGSAPGSARATGRAVIGVCVLLFVAVLLVFGRTAGFAFVDFDDPGTVSENPFITAGLKPAGILWAFTHTQVGDWIPLTAISHMLDCQVFGLWAGGHHLTNVVLHAVTSILLLLALRDMTGSLWRSAFVAALFALHPLRAESVAWVTERKDVLSGLFFMLALGAYSRWVRHSSHGRVWVCVFLALGLLCKAMLVTTPLVLLLLDRWPLQRVSHATPSRLMLEKLPLLLLSAAAAFAQLFAASEAMNSLPSYPLGARAANAIVSCAAYVTQTFWPANLASFYPYPRQGVGALALVSATSLLAIISAAAYRWRRQAPWIAVGWLWFLVMLVPVIGVVQAGEIARADRYTYLPQIGLFIAIAWTAGSWCNHGRQRRVLAGALGAVVIIAAGVAAARQTEYWRDSETLWNRALACTTNNDTAHYNLGTSRLQSGKIDEAIGHFEKTLDANPTYADAHVNLGRALLQKGRADDAIAHFHKAIDLKPGYAEAQYNLALALAQQGRLQDAITRYRRAIEIKPAYFDAHNNLGSALLQSGRIDEAMSEYKIALLIDPGSVKAHNNLAAALAQKGRAADAVAQFSKALQIDPDHVKANNGLAWLLATSSDARIRDGTRAVSLAERANRLTGGSNPLMLRTLAAAQAEAGRFDAALQAAQQALERAESQSNEPLARALREDVVSYKAGRPLR